MLIEDKINKMIIEAKVKLSGLEESGQIFTEYDVVQERICTLEELRDFLRSNVNHEFREN